MARSPTRWKSSPKAGGGGDCAPSTALGGRPYYTAHSQSRSTKQNQVLLSRTPLLETRIVVCGGEPRYCPKGDGTPGQDSSVQCCMPCTLGETWDHDGRASSPCLACKVCEANEIKTGACKLFMEGQTGSQELIDEQDTTCTACAVGEYANKNDPLQHVCTPCTTGKTWDHDKDPGTPCVDCTECKAQFYIRGNLGCTARRFLQLPILLCDHVYTAGKWF